MRVGVFNIKMVSLSFFLQKFTSDRARKKYIENLMNSIAFNLKEHDSIKSNDHAPTLLCINGATKTKKQIQDTLIGVLFPMALASRSHEKIMRCSEKFLSPLCTTFEFLVRSLRCDNLVIIEFYIKSCFVPATLGIKNTSKLFANHRQSGCNK